MTKIRDFLDHSKFVELMQPRKRNAFSVPENTGGIFADV